MLFTTIPIDQYTYTIVSHPNPELVGGEVVVSLPREPITVLTRREFYNAAILADAFHVDERVFKHVAGDPTSYPNRGEQATLLSQYEGIQSREVDVGEGGGSVSVGVSVYEEISSGSSYSWNASVDIKATAGVVVTGMSIGYGEGKTITCFPASRSLLSFLIHVIALTVSVNRGTPGIGSRAPAGTSVDPGGTTS